MLYAYRRKARTDESDSPHQVAIRLYGRKRKDMTQRSYLFLLLLLVSSLSVVLKAVVRNDVALRCSTLTAERHGRTNPALLTGTIDNIVSRFFCFLQHKNHLRQHYFRFFAFTCDFSFILARINLNKKNMYAKIGMYV